MNILSAILLGIAANLDNIIIGVMYGSKKIYISWKSNVVISTVILIITILALLFGSFISHLIPHNVANILSTVSLVLIGMYYLIDSLLIKKDETQKIMPKFGFKDKIILALTLSLNNLPIAIFSSIDGCNVFLVSSMLYLFSILMIYVGNFLGSKVSSNKISILSAILIIAVGILELFI